MKKILVSLLVMALCAPAMAATISITDLGGGQAEITVDSTADGVPIVGLGLDVDVTAGTVTAVDIAGLVTQKFDIFPDAAYTQELGAGYAYGTGTPVAAKTAPGEVALSDSFALSLANLNGEATPGANGATIVTIVLTLSETADITVCENATRGGIVATDATGLEAACVTETITVSTGPACWNNPCQPFGDANGDDLITSGDVQILLGTWPPNAYDPCGDFNQDGLITSGDVQILLGSWGGSCP